MKKPKENKLVVGSLSWASGIPGWLLDEIRVERLMLGLISLTKSSVPKVGDAEVCAYLLTSSLAAPLTSDYTKVYLYLASKVLKKKGKEIPDDICVDELSKYEERQLEELRSMIYRKRGGEIRHPFLDAMRIFRKTNETRADNVQEQAEQLLVKEKE